jgi:hypothetical protein
MLALHLYSARVVQTPTPFPHASSAPLPDLDWSPRLSEAVRYPLFRAQTGSRLQLGTRGSRRWASRAVVRGEILDAISAVAHRTWVTLHSFYWSEHFDALAANPKIKN